MIRKVCIAAALTALSVFILSTGAPAPAAAQGACMQFNVGKPWVAVQGGTRVTFGLRQTGTSLRGTARVETPAERGFLGTVSRYGAVFSGRVQGTVNGPSLVLNTDWGGVYQGTIDPTGQITGTTHDRKHPGSRASWRSDRKMDCFVRAGAPKTTVPVQQTTPGTLRREPSGGASAIRQMQK